MPDFGGRFCFCRLPGLPLIRGPQKELTAMRKYKIPARARRNDAQLVALVGSLLILPQKQDTGVRKVFDPVTRAQRLVRGIRGAKRR